MQIEAALERFRDVLVTEWLPTEHRSIEEAYNDAADRLVIIAGDNPGFFLRAGMAICDKLPEGTHMLTIGEAKAVFFDAVSTLVPATSLS